MKTTSKSQIIEIISKNRSTPHELHLKLQISPQALHRHLKALTMEGLIERIGRPPHVYYILASGKPTSQLQKISLLSPEANQFLEIRFMYFNPQGEIKRGVEGFYEWAVSTKQDKQFSQLTNEFISTREHWDTFKDQSLQLIEASEKFKTTFQSSPMEHVYYVDFYSLPKFGKTVLGNLVLHAKQAQDKKLIKVVASHIKEPLLRLIKKEKIDAVVWVPHSLPRKVAFLKEIRMNLQLSIPEIKLRKAYKGQVPIAQKSLSKLEERIKNAESTIFLEDTTFQSKRILIIDDAVGSGATLQAVSEKIKQVNKNAKIFGFAFVGSIKGFEVITEV